MFNERENRKGIKPARLAVIFKRFAINSKNMDFKGFVKAINYLAVDYFEERIDRREEL